MIFSRAFDTVSMIIVDDRYCKGCDICVRFCPKHILAVSKEANSRGYYTPRVIDQKECNKCRQCELLCPDFAIFIVEDEDGDDG